MGNWHISIQGTGPHHNNLESDADNLSKELVKLLKKHGHTIESATFTFGGKNNIEPGVDILINGKEYQVGQNISYDDVARFVDAFEPTITYKYLNGVGGMICRGQRIITADGMRFTAVNTGNA